MTIFLLQGSGAGNSFLGNALRTAAISSGKGGLFVDEKSDGDPRHLLEKIIDGQALPDKSGGIPIDSIRWKKDPTIALSGPKGELLKTFETWFPGFVKKFGPVYKVGNLI